MAGIGSGLLQPRRQNTLPTQHLQHDGQSGDDAGDHQHPHQQLGQCRALARLHPHPHPSREQDHRRQIGNADQEMAEVAFMQLQTILQGREQQPKAAQQAQAIEAKLLVFSRQVPMGRTPEQAQTQKGQQVGVDARRQRIDVRHRGDRNHHQH